MGALTITEIKRPPRAFWKLGAKLPRASPALASYAKQARDESPFKSATRIRARAIDRAGALLKEFDARGDHRKKAPEGLSSKTQRKAAEESGMSVKQQKTAVHELQDRASRRPAPAETSDQRL
jgi:hypothetical protein